MTYREFLDSLQVRYDVEVEDGREVFIIDDRDVCQGYGGEAYCGPSGDCGSCPDCLFNMARAAGVVEDSPTCEETECTECEMFGFCSGLGFCQD